ncbi:hypothetical protein STXM2123_4487 [Streptomyces sp. F-3]|uniref:DUF2690 domain-containing protein n=1 Tax=Streptomyces sp. F-3 TaxID=1840095 RepID=UPI0007C3BA9C|nr:DUF2690 domain-containing protein [Streptomyces sp. F-3]GAT83786.1 hypothetical protein STXM2123_4487 [Streptomyces sp. F-3]
MSQANTDPVAEYAAALKSAFERCGLTQKKLASEVPFSETAISRYFSGERIADEDFIEALATVRANCGVPLSSEDLADLHRLRQRAQQTRGGEKNRIAQWRDRVQLLEKEKEDLERRLQDAQARSEHEREATRAALADLDRKVEALGAELRQALDRASVAERERDELRDRAGEQQHQLEHATAYTQRLEKDLTDSREEVQLLRREVEVLRNQVRRLHDESTVASDHQAVATVATQVSTVAAGKETAHGTRQEPSSVSAGGDETASKTWDSAPAVPSVELIELIAAIRQCKAELGWSYSMMGRKTNTSADTWYRWCTQPQLPHRDALVSFAEAAPEVMKRYRLLDLWEAAREVQELAQETEKRAAGLSALANRPLALGLFLLSAVGVIALLLGLTVWILSVNDDDAPGGHAAPTASTSASAPARPSPTISCHGESCASLDPARTYCADDAVTAYSGQKYGAMIELRHSPSCGTVWAKMSRTSAGDRVIVTHRDGRSEEYRQQYGRDAHTPMLVVDSPEDAKACAIIQDRGTVCATQRGAVAPTPTATGR